MSFPTKENPQLCKNGCGTKIYLSDKKQKGRYLPYELSDIIHDCPKKPTTKPVNGHNLNGNGNGNNNGNNDISLEVVLKKLESIGITIDLDKLRNASI